MILDVTDFAANTKGPRDVPDAVIKKFLHYLIGASRFTLAASPESLVILAMELRRDILQQSTPVEAAPPAEPVPPGYESVTLVVLEAEAQQLRDAYPAPWNGPVAVPA